MAYHLLQSIVMMQNGFRVFTEYCLSGIEANEEKLREYVEKSVGIITAVNPHIGYEAATRIAREAILTGKSVRELCLEMNVLTEAELERILDPYEMTHSGIVGQRIAKK